MSKLSRRSLVAGAASLPALAAGTAVAAKVEPDAAFARIEEYRRAYAEHGAALKVAEDGDWAEEAGEASYQAAISLCKTSPTTLAGLAAVVNFVMESCDSCENHILGFVDPDYEDDEARYDDGTLLQPFLAMIADTVEQLARVS